MIRGRRVSVAKKTAVVLVNLGTPEQPTAGSVRTYLREFLSDTRVIEIPKFIWWFVLNGIILTFRPPKVAKLYKKIWTDKGSPMRVILQSQADKLQLKLAREMEGQQSQNAISVYAAMTYGPPNLDDVIRRALDDGANKLVFLPLYPQYSATSTAAVFDRITKTTAQIRNLPEMVFIKDYHDHPAYIDALVNAITVSGAMDDTSIQQHIFSFHGIPKANEEKGDPYPSQCKKTAELIAEKLQLPDSKWRHAFQSRFGPAKWVEPYLDEMLEQLPGEGIKSVVISCPAFSADCLETLEEIAIENKELFEESGGESYRYIPALNDRDDHIECMAQVVKPYL